MEATCARSRARKRSLQIETDRPMRDGGVLALDDQQLKLSPSGQGNVYTATVHIDKDGLYHVATD